jgi:GNAT superfamily N-acetyltransferase
MTLAENPLNGSLSAIASTGTAAILVPDIRRLERQDEAELRRILLGLDAAARCKRFGQAAGNAYMAEYAKNALTSATWIAGAFVDQNLRGVVEVYDGGPGRCAEAAFVVEQEWRRRGLGWALLRSALQMAAEAGTQSLRMIFSQHNWPMQKLAAKARGRFDMALDEIVVDVALDCLNPNPSTLG